MTDSELIILSLVKDGLNYPYIIEKVIEERELRDYFELSFSSIYFLITTLEKKGYIETFSSFGKKKLMKKAIRLTEKGEEALKDSFNKRFLSKPLLSHPIDYLMYNCHHLTPDEIKTGLNKYINESDRIYTYYKQKIDDNYATTSLPVGDLIVVKHFLYRLKAELDWAKDIKNYIHSTPGIEELLERQKSEISDSFKKLLCE